MEDEVSHVKILVLVSPPWHTLARVLIVMKSQGGQQSLEPVMQACVEARCTEASPTIHCRLFNYIPQVTQEIVAYERPSRMRLQLSEGQTVSCHCH